MSRARSLVGKTVSFACGRRRFVEIVAGSVVATGAVACSSAAEPESFGDVPAGNIKDLVIGSVVALHGVPGCIACDAKGVYAMTLTCTHEGCDMGSEGTVTASRISCACHGSVFDATGAVVRGPAKEPLQHFAVSADAQGNLTVHGGSAVDANVRLSV